MGISLPGLAAAAPAAAALAPAGLLTALRLALAVPLLLGGLFFLAVGTIGLVRLPDVFTRMHATGKCDTLGAGLTLLALAVVAPAPAVALRYLLIVALILVINPTTAHVIGNAAYRYGGLDVPGTGILDLRGEGDAPTAPDGGATSPAPNTGTASPIPDTKGPPHP